MKKIILASTSKYRKELLSRLRINFETASSELDESKYKQKITDPYELSLELAKAKAKAVFDENPDAIVIGSDQVCHLEGHTFSKPGSLDNALETLKSLSGKTHELVTSYALISSEGTKTHTNVTKLTMKDLDESSLKNYLIQDNPVDCAGAYKLELKGIALFSNILSDDHTAIVGLPLMQLAQDLETMGIDLFKGKTL